MVEKGVEKCAECLCIFKKVSQIQQPIFTNPTSIEFNQNKYCINQSHKAITNTASVSWTIDLSGEAFCITSNKIQWNIMLYM